MIIGYKDIFSNTIAQCICAYIYKDLHICEIANKQFLHKKCLCKY